MKKKKLLINVCKLLPFIVIAVILLMSKPVEVRENIAYAYAATYHVGYENCYRDNSPSTWCCMHKCCDSGGDDACVATDCPGGNSPSGGCDYTAPSPE